jgi:serine/threonine protein kinase
MNEREVFDAALTLADPTERSAYLDQACAGDPSLREHIEGLLEMHGQLGTFLEVPALAPAVTTLDPASSERPGAVIGPYKLLEQIGEGGFGIVFMAEQQQPLRRKVALKVLKPGMDTRQVIARFEAERQALALMEHPNIAHVLDAGATASGRPYFVMELVRGVPVTDFCDQHKLPPRQRLELFATICQAVQHAHQKGLIHRDLKPTNILVTLHDGKPVVKVIDFGIAKALGQQLTDKTLFTGFAQFVGTPLYMSPEQAEMSGLDVDTRSDIYSLGVLLYELLTGTTPFGQERLKQAGYDEIRRIIREEEPPRPSTRLSTLGQAADTVSAALPARRAGAGLSAIGVVPLPQVRPALQVDADHGPGSDDGAGADGGGPGGEFDSSVARQPPGRGGTVPNAASPANAGASAEEGRTEPVLPEHRPRRPGVVEQQRRPRRPDSRRVSARASPLGMALSEAFVPFGAYHARRS